MSIIPNIIHTPVCLKQPIWLNYDNYPRFSQQLTAPYPPLPTRWASATCPLRHQVQFNFSFTQPSHKNLRDSFDRNQLDVGVTCKNRVQPGH